METATLIRLSKEKLTKYFLIQFRSNLIRPWHRRNDYIVCPSSFPNTSHAFLKKLLDCSFCYQAQRMWFTNLACPSPHPQRNHKTNNHPMNKTRHRTSHTYKHKSPAWLAVCLKETCCLHWPVLPELSSGLRSTCTSCSSSAGFKQAENWQGN